MRSQVTTEFLFNQTGRRLYHSCLDGFFLRLFPRTIFCPDEYNLFVYVVKPDRPVQTYMHIHLVRIPFPIWGGKGLCAKALKLQLPGETGAKKKTILRMNKGLSLGAVSDSVLLISDRQSSCSQEQQSYFCR